MTSSSIRIWYLVHKWTSLICTAFLLMLCITGLPLIFHDEIDQLSGETPHLGMSGVGSSGNAPGLLPLDTMMARALAAQPGEIPLFMAFNNEQPLMTITTGPKPDAVGAEMTIQLLDRSTGKTLGKEDRSGVMPFILKLHTDMFRSGRPRRRGGAGDESPPNLKHHAETPRNQWGNISCIHLAAKLLLA